jgi:D-tyrosyl-tRNA(Tyr) deacylase
LRAVAARVTSASVTVDGRVTGAIARPGLLVLLGVHTEDTPENAVAMARKLHELRILRDEESCATSGAPLLVVSQFTLYGETRKGRRPSWIHALAPNRRNHLSARWLPSCVTGVRTWKPVNSGP